RQPAMAAQALRQLAHRQPFALGKGDGALAPAFAGVALGNFGKRSVGIEFCRIGAERDRQRGDGALVIDEAIELRALLLRFGEAVANIDHAAGKNLDVLGIAPGLLGAALYVAAEGLAVLDAAQRGEDRVRDLGAELAPGI